MTTVWRRSRDRRASPRSPRRRARARVVSRLPFGARRRPDADQREVARRARPARRPVVAVRRPDSRPPRRRARQARLERRACSLRGPASTLCGFDVDADDVVPALREAGGRDASRRSRGRRRRPSRLAGSRSSPQTSPDPERDRDHGRRRVVELDDGLAAREPATVARSSSARSRRARAPRRASPRRRTASRSVTSVDRALGVHSRARASRLSRTRAAPTTSRANGLLPARGRRLAAERAPSATRSRGSPSAVPRSTTPSPWRSTSSCRMQRPALASSGGDLRPETVDDEHDDPPSIETTARRCLTGSSSRGVAVVLRDDRRRRRDRHGGAAPGVPSPQERPARLASCRARRRHGRVEAGATKGRPRSPAARSSCRHPDRRRAPRRVRERRRGARPRAHARRARDSRAGRGRRSRERPRAEDREPAVGRSVRFRAAGAGRRAANRSAPASPKSHHASDPARRHAPRAGMAERAASARRGSARLAEVSASRTSARPSSASPYVGARLAVAELGPEGVARAPERGEERRRAIDARGVEARDREQEEVDHETWYANACSALVPSARIWRSASRSSRRRALAATLRVPQLRREQADRDEADELADAVVVGGAARRGIALDPAPVLPERPEHVPARSRHPGNASREARRTRSRARWRGCPASKPLLQAIPRPGGCAAIHQLSRGRPRPRVRSSPLTSQACDQEGELLAAIQLPDPLGIAGGVVPVVSRFAWRSGQRRPENGSRAKSTGHGSRCSGRPK